MVHYPKKIPSTISIDGMCANENTPYVLHECTERRIFYYKKIPFGFAHGIEILETHHVDKPSKKITIVKHLSANSWGKTEDGKQRTAKDPYTLAWVSTRVEYYPTMQRAVDALLGKTETPKGKRKPRPIEPMTEEELLAWAET